MKKFGRVKVSSGVRDLRADIHRDLWDNLLSQTHTRAEDTIIHSITSRSSQAFQNPVLASVSLQIFPTGHNPVPHENDNRFECLSNSGIWSSDGIGAIARFSSIYVGILVFPGSICVYYIYLDCIAVLKKRA